MKVAGRFDTDAGTGFHWLTSSEHRLFKLLKACPDLVLGRRLVVTSFDSGPLPLKPEEIAAGWVRQDAIAISPVISEIGSLDADGWDEWYIFEHLPVLSQIDVYVNNGGFRLAETPAQSEPDPTWCRAADTAERESRREEMDGFWTQLTSINPESYIADGDLLNFATSNEHLFAKVRNSLGL